MGGNLNGCMEVLVQGFSVSVHDCKTTLGEFENSHRKLIFKWSCTWANMELAASNVKFSFVLSAGMASLYPRASSSELKDNTCITQKRFHRKAVDLHTLGMTCLVAPGRVFLLQPQQPPVASHKDRLVIKLNLP